MKLVQTRRCECGHWREDHNIRGSSCNVVIAQSKFDGCTQDLLCRCVRYKEQIRS